MLYFLANLDFLPIQIEFQIGNRFLLLIGPSPKENDKRQEEKGKSFLVVDTCCKGNTGIVNKKVVEILPLLLII
jgi:hypothetical protein